MLNLGDFPASATIDFKWNTQGANGASITRSTDGTLKLYKGNSATERSSLAGVTQSEDFDAATGVHHVRIDLADNTDAGFYAAGNEYQVVMTGMTIDGQVVNAVIAHFSIERANGILALLKSGTFGLSALKTLIDAVDDLVDTEVAAIKAKTDNLPTDPADESLLIAATDAIMARLGPPAGASVSADVAAVKAETASLQSDTNDLQTRVPAALTGAGHMKADALALDGSTTAAVNLKQSATVIYVGSVTGATTTTTLIDSALTQADADCWKGRVITFLTGTLKYQATDITAFDPATDKLTFTALTAAPSGGDTYVVV